MNFTREINSIKIKGLNTAIFRLIETVQYFEETDESIILEWAESTPKIERGLMCNMIVSYKDVNLDGKQVETHEDKFYDLLLTKSNRRGAFDENISRTFVFSKR